MSEIQLIPCSVKDCDGRIWVTQRTTPVNGGIEWRRGDSRRVALVGSLAIKVPRVCNSAEGLACNLKEIERWRQCPKYCPIIWWGCDGRVVVMSRAAPVTPREADQILRDSDVLESDYTFCPMIPGDHTAQVELNENNVGVVAGRFVILDFGDP